MQQRKALAILVISLASVLLAACGAEPVPTQVPPTQVSPTQGRGFLMSPTQAPEIMPELKESVVLHYASGVHATYEQSLQSAQQLDQAIDRFLANPTPSTLEAAKRAWLRARDDYSPTEAYRFYGGPIDHEEDGPEGLINAWPLDEAYIDYVAGNPDAGIINDPAQFPVIDAELLLSLNEVGGETNIATGWHAIEFLLWGQDLNEDGPGDRSVADYTTSPNADRRGTYLAVASDLLLVHLQQLIDAWDPNGQNNYRAEFISLDPDTALTRIITGIGELSRGELAGERMTVAYEERSQEDEHSCFSDNTTADILGNARGIQMVYLGEYGDLSGPGLDDLIAAADHELAARLTQEIARSVALASRIPAPFDQHLRDTVPNSDPGRAAILNTVEALEQQTDTLVDAAQAVGITLNVS